MTITNSRTPQHRYRGDETGTKAPEAPPTAPPTPGKKEMTQAEIDAIVSKRVNEERAKALKEQQILLERVKALEPEAEKRAELEKRIEDIERAGLTEKQLAEMERKKHEKLLIDRAQKSEEEAKQTRAIYEAEKLQRDLLDVTSAKETDAYNAQQLAALLRPASRLVKKVVDGKVTNELEVRVKYVGTKDGQPIELDATPAEAIKFMKEDPTNANLFKAGVVGGIGGSQPKTLANKANGKLGLSQDEFNKLYNKGKLPKD